MATAAVSALAREAPTLITCSNYAYLALTAAARVLAQATVHPASAILL